ncbi:hypothetical protein X777_05360, partial [Ooceraea biroi]
EYVRKFEIVNLTETWIEEKGWKKMEAWMPKEFKWEIQYATRDKKKGRGSGGMIVGVKKNIRMKDVQKETRGIISYKVKIKGEIWRIISIYNREGKKRTLEELEEKIENEREKKLIIGDFNARTAQKGEIVWNGEEESKRTSKDKTINRQGMDLIEKIEKMGLGILNGNKEEDEQGKWTFTGTMGKSVIDYAICNAETWEEIKSFKIGERTEADHQPLVVEMKAKIEEIEDWSEEGIKIYKENLKRRKTEKKEHRKNGKNLVEEIKKAITKDGIGQKTWWDKKCRNSKTKLNRSLRTNEKRNDRKKRIDRKKQRHNKLCERKRKEDREREQKRLAEISNETEIWRYIRKEKEWKEMETLQERYIRWTLGLDRCTPGYIVREETKTEQISIEAGGRVLKYQEKMKRETENEILKECRREINNTEWEKTQWGRRMKMFYEEGGTS